MDLLSEIDMIVSKKSRRWSQHFYFWWKGSHRYWKIPLNEIDNGA